MYTTRMTLPTLECMFQACNVQEPCFMFMSCSFWNKALLFLFKDDGLDVHFALLFSGVMVVLLSRFPWTFPHLWQEHFVVHGFLFTQHGHFVLLLPGMSAHECVPSLFFPDSPHLHGLSLELSLPILLTQFRHLHLVEHDTWLITHGQWVFFSSSNVQKFTVLDFAFRPQ